MAYKWRSWDVNTGLWVPASVFPTDGAGQYLDGAETKPKSARVSPTFCKGRTHSVGEMPIFRSPETRVLLWVKVNVAVVL